MANPYHDELGRFTDAEGASVGGSSSRARTPAVPASLMDPEERATAERSARARATYKPSTREKQRAAESNEARLAEILGAKPTKGNAPMDVVFRDPDGRKVGIEVKTFLDNSNDKITMHPESLDRKEKWAKRNDARLLTVLFDDRKGSTYSGHPVYVAEGVGSFRLKSMRPTTLRQLNREFA